MMDTSLLLFSILCGLFGIIYILLILFYTLGWYRLKTYRPTTIRDIKTRASVIVPARNARN